MLYYRHKGYQRRKYIGLLWGGGNTFENDSDSRWL